MFLFPYIRERSMRPKVEREKKFYNQMPLNKIPEYQFKMFNQLWQNVQKNVSFYRDLLSNSDIPKNIRNFSDLKQLPIIDRSKANKYMNALIDRSQKPDTWGTTGGSTGNPLQFPMWKSEKQASEPTVWYGRDFYNIKRSDRLLRLWGHSHTLGVGLSRYINIMKFKIGLPLIGYKRLSAYDLSTENLREVGNEILEFKPDYIIGYSKALHRLAQANENKKEAFHKLNLKVVIGAAEGFQKKLDQIYVGDIFGCHVALQYAAMETNYLAHTHLDGGYRAFWKNNLIECVDEAGNPSESGRILVTTLYPRAFPLIRYDVGDIITGTRKTLESVYEFDDIQGRDNDFLMIDEDTPIHSESITHAVKSSEKISAYQIRYTKDHKYTVYLISNDMIERKDKEEIKHRLAQIDKRLLDFRIKQVDSLKQTIAGKTNWLIEE